MSTPLDSAKSGLWVALQTAKGTPATAARKRLRAVSGGMSIKHEHGRESFADGRRLSSASDYTDRIYGQGSLVAQGQPGVLGFFAHAMLGAEDHTPADTGTPSLHELTISESGSKWMTVWQTSGDAAGAVSRRELYADCKISSLAIEASQANKTVHATAEIMSMDPAKVIASGDVPAVAIQDVEPLLYTDGTGSFTLAGGVVASINEVRVTISDELEPYYGDDYRPEELIAKRLSIEVAATAKVDSATLPIFNLIHYGTATPAAGAKPVSTVFHGAFEFGLSRGTGEDRETLLISVPHVVYSPDIEYQVVQPDGGAVELAFGGSARDNGTDPAITVAVETGTEADDDLPYALS